MGAGLPCPWLRLLLGVARETSTVLEASWIYEEGVELLTVARSLGGVSAV